MRNAQVGREQTLIDFDPILVECRFGLALRSETCYFAPGSSTFATLVLGVHDWQG
jgi:hypothetical protein